jgi:heterodisulfide reductase subunit C
MMHKLAKDDIQSEILGQIERVSGEELNKCYQCGNCTGSCPVSFAMEIPPTKTIRMLQLGKVDDVLKANSMWLCVSCLQCYSRCPKAVSAANLFEALRQLSLRKGESHEEIKDLPFPFLKGAPQQAIVSGFRKFVS